MTVDLAKRGTIREERPDLLKYLVNEEDGELSCGSHKRINIKCPKCFQIKEIITSHFTNNGFSCNTIRCVNNKNSTKNTIEKERPDLIEYLVNIKDKNLTCGSNKKISVKCPICGKVKSTKVIVRNLCNQKFNCENTICSNNVHIRSAKSKVKKHRLQVGETINNMLVLKQIRISNNKIKAYELKCNLCNGIHIMRETDLITKQCNCPTCTNRKVIKGINDIATTHPELVKYFKDKNQCYKYTRGSHKKVTIVCPICNSEKKIMICSIPNEYSCDNNQCTNYYHNKISNTKHMNMILNNDYLGETHPQLIKYLKNKEDKFFSRGSKQKITVKCPICGNEKETRLLYLTNQGFSCSSCGDGNSYPNKFMESLIRQSGFEFFTEHRFDWAIKNNTHKIYDVYIPNLSCIIENHGGQHYKRSFEKIGGRTLEEEQENDKLKKELAKENGIKDYFEIDCRKSELNWIKNSIIKSGLLELLKLTEDDIDWTECHKYAVKSKVYYACELWNDGLSIKDISTKLCVNNNTITKYLQQGKELRLCDYQEYKARIRGKNTRLVCINNKIFYSIAECARYCNVNRRIMNKWLLNPVKMPQKYIDLGLRYATEEDLNTHELVS